MNQILIPKSWKWVTFADVADLASGNPAPQGNEFFEDGIYPFVRVQDMGNLEDCIYIHKTKDKLNEGGTKKMKLFPKGSVLFTKSGMSLLLNQRAILPKNMYVVSHIGVAQPKQEVLSEFLYYWLKSIDFKIFSHATSLPSVQLSKIREIPFPLPPIEIQKKIVQKLNYVLNQIQEKKKEILDLLNIKSTQEIISKNIEQLLKIALEGKLTKEWRILHKTELEQSTVLKDILLRNRRKKWEIEQLARFKASNKTPKNFEWKNKYKNPLEPESNLPELPELWTWVTLNQITWSVKDGPHYSPEYVSKGIPFISGGNVRASGIDFENAKRISPQLHEDLSKRCKPEKNDILYTKGGTTGIARVNSYDIEFNVWVHVAVLKLVDPINPFYVQHALNSPFCYRQAQSFTHGVGNQDLGLTRLICISLPLPPIEEQLEIAKILNRKFSELEPFNIKINDIITKKQAVVKYLNNFSSSILNQAFLGKLLN